MARRVCLLVAALFSSVLVVRVQAQCSLPAPVVTSTLSRICPDAAGTAMVTNADASYTYAWKTLDAAATIDGSSTGASVHFTAGHAGKTVRLEVAVTNACGSATRTVTIDGVAEPAPIFGAPAVCPNSTGNTLATSSYPNATYQWTLSRGTITSGSTAAQMAWTAPAAGVVDVALARSECGVTVTTAEQIISGPPIDPMIWISGGVGAPPVPPAAGVCAHATMTVTAPDAGPGAEYDWTITNASNVVTAQNSATFEAGASGTVGVSLTITDACDTKASGALSIAIDPPQTVEVHGMSTACAGSFGNGVSVTPLSGATYQWTIVNGTFATPPDQPVVSYIAGASGQTTLTVTMTRCGHTATATHVVTIDAPPVSSISTPLASACTSTPAPAFLDPAGNGSTYAWTIANGTIQTDSTAPFVQFTADGTADVTLTAKITQCGRTTTLTKSVPASRPLDATIAVPSTICPSTAGLSASVPERADGLYSWTIENGTITSGARTSHVTFTAGAAGTTKLTVIVGSTCGSFLSSSASAVIGLPSLAIDGPSNVCAGGTVTLSASPGFTAYAWSNGATTRTITVAPAASTDYTVTATVGSCSSTATHGVTVAAAAVAEISGRANGALTTLTATPGALYLWSNGAATQSIDVAPGTYSVRVTGSGGCVAISADLQVAPAGLPESQSCAGDAVTLAGPAGFPSYVWSTGETSPSIRVTPRTTTEYSVTATSGTARAMAWYTVDVSPYPDATISMTPNSTSVTLTAPAGGASYFWSPTGATTQSIDVTSGAHSVTVTNAAGCTTVSPAARVVQLTVGSNVTASAGTADVLFSAVTSPGIVAARPLPISDVVLPTGYATAAVSTAIDITTTATFAGSARLMFRLTPAQLASITRLAFENLRILHGENGVFVDRTVFLDYLTGAIFAEVTSFSPFALVMRNAPALSAVTGPADPLPLGAAASVAATFADASPGPHTATIAWGDDTTSPASLTQDAGGSGALSGSHTYAAAGIYRVVVTLTNQAGAAVSKPFQYVIVFDPHGGFVTGGGTFASPEKTPFAFNVRYGSNGSRPAGSVKFLDFDSTAIDWLVITSQRALFRGAGTWNRRDGYSFLVAVTDGNPDRLRVKIWNTASGAVVFDNQPGAADDADPAAAILGGSIVIHL
jgi:hypothetical protein